jgi:hypothetical protein
MMKKKLFKMKKVNTALILALSAILLAFLSSSLTPVQALDPKSDCKCNHYDEREINTQWDEVTGTGITGSYGGGTTFYWIQILHYRGLGGYYQPPSPPNIAAMDAHSKYTDSYGNHNYDYTYNSPVPWTYPYYPGFGSFPYHAQAVYDNYWPSGGTYGEGSSSSWFQWPPNPYSYWYDQGSIASVTY